MEPNVGTSNPAVADAVKRTVQARRTADLDMAGRIKSVVAERFHLKVRDLEGAQKLLRIALARQIAMYLIRQLTGLTYSAIAAIFNRDHSTVVHNCAVIAARMAQPQFAQMIRELKESCGRRD